MQDVFFLTTNSAKIKSMTRWSDMVDIKITPMKTPSNQPERKDDSIENIAKFKILDNKNFVNANFVVHDSGFFLDAVPGFPGPNVNHTLTTIGLEGILNMTPKDNRKCCFKNVLAFWSPSLEINQPKNPIIFFKSEVKGFIAELPAKNNIKEAWSELWRIFIPEGYKLPFADLKKFDREKFEETQNLPHNNTFALFAKWYKTHHDLFYIQKTLF